ncbi:PLDc N-terminal domain-containing protein [soil metagenome]
MIRVIVPLILTAVMVFTIVDLITIDNSRVRGLPKFAWIILAVILPIVGSIIWFMVGREPLEQRSGGRYRDSPHSSAPRTVRRGPTAPDDDTEFLGKLSRETEQEKRIRQLEERLAELDDDKPKD